jgi:glycosyltransferase involved in cell wall biosynthesis
VKVALVSAFLEDDVYEHRLTNQFMKDVICEEDHFYHRIAKSLTNRNIDVTVFYMSQEKETKEFFHKYGHSIMRVPAKKIKFIHEPIVYSPEIIKKIRTYDICQFISGYYVNYKIPDMFDYIVKKINGEIPIFARWAGGNHKWLFPIRKKIKINSLNKCENIICSGKDEIKVLQDIFKIPNKKIIHLANPIDFDLFKKRDREKALEKVGLKKNKRYFLYVGRLSKNKGIEETLNVFKKLISEYNDIKLIIIGDGPMLKYIKNFVDKNNLNLDILLTGRLPHEVACYYYNLASVLINVGHSGGLANVIIEAMASNLPIIATDVGASKEYVGEKFKNGILIKSNNEFELKKALITILENNEKFRNYNKKKIEKFTYENFGEKTSQIYEQCLNKPNNHNF